MFKRFLWNRGDNIQGKASVAWKEVCKPKSQGGLGLKSVSLWNKALMIKHLWNIVSKKNSLWVNWIYLYRLKGKCIWNITLRKGTPWSWKKLLDLRDMIREFIWVKIGNGKDCNIWFDRWHHSGPFCKTITQSDLDMAGMDSNAKVADLIDENGWSWPMEWDGKFDAMLNVPVPHIDSNRNDKMVLD